MMNEKSVIAEIMETLESASDYFDSRSDVVDGSYGIPEANKEMILLQQCEVAIKRLSALQKHINAEKGVAA
jgi:hypothetical protein